MLLTALPPAPPTPKTVIFGFSSLMSGIFRLIVMALVLTHSAVSRPSAFVLPDRAPPPRTPDAIIGV